MSLRQAQRSLAELISMCEAAHVQLPKNALEARIEAMESIIHSLKDNKPNLNDALEELQQKFGIQREWIQRQDNKDAKHLRRRQSHQNRRSLRGKEDTMPAHEEFMLNQLSKDTEPTSLTPSKRPILREKADPQETAEMKDVKKIKRSQELQPPPARSATVTKGEHEDGITCGSPVHELIGSLEDSDKVDEGDGSMSSDEEAGKLLFPHLA